jgi:hypothetical protein
MTRILITNNYHDKSQAYAGERWMKSGRMKRLRKRVECNTRVVDRVVTDGRRVLLKLGHAREPSTLSKNQTMVQQGAN